MVGIGYVSNINDKGCFIKAGFKATVRASLAELSDTAAVNPTALYKVNDPVLFRVISVTEPKKQKTEGMAQKNVNVSLKESIVKYGLDISIKNLKPGTIVQCIIRKKEEGNKLWVQIKGSSLLGVVKNAPEELQEKELIHCKIEKIEEVNETKNKIKMRYEGKVDISSEPNKIEELFQKIEEERKQSTGDSAVPMQEVVEINPEKEPEIILKQDELKILEEVEEKQNESESEDEQIIQETMHDDEKEEEKEEEKESPEEQMEDIESTKKTSQHMKEKVREEKRLRQIEKQNISQNPPQSLEEFEKQVVAEPNNSYVWLQYVAFILDKAGIDSARRVIKL